MPPTLIPHIPSFACPSTNSLQVAFSGRVACEGVPFEMGTWRDVERQEKANCPGKEAIDTMISLDSDEVHANESDSH